MMIRIALFDMVLTKGMLAGLPTLLSASAVPCEVCWELDEEALLEYCSRAGLPGHMAMSLSSVGRASEDEAIELQARALALGLRCPVTLMVTSRDKNCPTCAAESSGLNMAEVQALARKMGGEVIDFGAGATWTRLK